MKQGGKASGIWFVLFWVCFVVMILSVAALLWQHIGRQTANVSFKELQSEANADVQEDAVELVYDAQMTETGQLVQTGNGGQAESTAEADHTVQAQNTTQAENIAKTESMTQAGSAGQAEANKLPPVTDVRTGQQSQEMKAEAGQKPDASLVGAKQETAAVQTPDKTLDWEALHSKNPDIYAWIYVPDTGVDYPVVQHPTDNSYYLNHNLDGSKGYPGCIYTENFNNRDFSDLHTVLYGHNLKDKTMFSTLHNFEDAELFQKEHDIYIYTEDAVLTYRIFAAYEFSAIHLLDNFDYTNEYVYEDYLKQIRQAAGNIRQDVEVTTADRIITLSTCTADHDAARRYLVTGVLVSEKGQTGQ